MKKIISIALALTISMGATAGGHGTRGGARPHIYHAPVSHFYHAPVYHNYNPRVSHVNRGHSTRVYIRPSLGFGYYLGYPYDGFDYPYYSFYNPYWSYPYYSERMPSALSLRINAIKNDYKLQIKDTRRNKTIPGSERRADIAQLKHDRDQAVINAEMNYRPGRANNQQNIQQNNFNDSNDPS